jgi:hypothetical protein
VQKNNLYTFGFDYLSDLQIKILIDMKSLKLRFTIACLLVCIVVFTGYNVRSNEMLSNQNSLLFHNVEGLAKGEGEGEGGCQFKLTATFEQRITVWLDQYTFISCKYLFRETFQCVGIGDVECRVGDIEVEAGPYDCSYGGIVK